VVLDATYSRRLHRDRLRNRLRKAGVVFCFVEAKASDNVVQQRLKERTAKSSQVSDARIEDFQMLSRLYEPPKELPARELVAINTSKTPPEATATEGLKALADRCAKAERRPATPRRKAAARPLQNSRASSDIVI
jgi:predicted kinase